MSHFYIVLLIVFSCVSQNLDNSLKTKLKAKNAFSEIDGNSILTFVNGRDKSLSVYGQIEISNKVFELENNEVKLSEEFLTNLGDKEISFRFVSEEYISAKFTLKVYIGQIYNSIFIVMDKLYPKKIQVVLNWNNSGGNYDLDSHMVSDDHHVYYKNKSSYSRGTGIYLNRDVVRSNTFETIVVNKPNYNDTYKYFVKKYKGKKDWIGKHVEVHVYYENALQKSFLLNKNGGTRHSVWAVFKIDRKGVVSDVDRLQDKISLWF